MIEPSDPPIPGLTADRATLDLHARTLVMRAVKRGAPLGMFVLHIEPERVSWQRRDELANDLRHAGVRDLSKKLRAAIVPPDQVLVLIDADETHLTLLSVASFAATADAAGDVT